MTFMLTDNTAQIDSLVNKVIGTQERLAQTGETMADSVNVILSTWIYPLLSVVAITMLLVGIYSLMMAYLEGTSGKKILGCTLIAIGISMLGIRTYISYIQTMIGEADASVGITAMYATKSVAYVIRELTTTLGRLLLIISIAPLIIAPLSDDIVIQNTAAKAAAIAIGIYSFGDVALSSATLLSFTSDFILPESKELMVIKILLGLIFDIAAFIGILLVVRGVIKALEAAQQDAFAITMLKPVVFGVIMISIHLIFDAVGFKLTI